MTLVRTSENEKAGFNLYFLGYGDKPAEGGGTADREGLLELTWNYGTEKDENFSYHDGNKEPQGFGHICEFPLLRSFLYGGLLTMGNRHLGRRPRCGVRPARGAQGQLEEEVDGWADEECGVCAGSGWVLG